MRPWPYVERRRLLLEVLAAARPPIQPVPATDALTVAAEWYTSLQPQGIEGIVAKPAWSAYRPARIWRKVRHAETVDLPRAPRMGANGYCSVARTMPTNADQASGGTVRL
ncbi:hypothetical protein SUDANB99_05997 (plasmid) [Streptomyces sp. enrichment culture]